MINRNIPLLLILLFLLGACKTPRQAVGSNNDTNESAANLLEKVIANNLEFETLSIKGKGKIESPTQNLGFTYKLNLIKDSLIWGSLTKFGYEALRVRIDPDSIQLKVKDQKQHVKCDFGMIQALTGMKIDFANLQNLLLGQYFEIADSLFGVTNQNNIIQLQGQRATNPITYLLSAQPPKIQQIKYLQNAKGTTTKLTYMEPMDSSYSFLPSIMELEVTDSSTKKILLNHTSVVRNPESLYTKFVIPSSYSLELCQPIKQARND